MTYVQFSANRFFEIPKSILPETVMSSSEVYSSIQDRGCQLRGTPLAGILGDQQAALVGQTWPSRHFQNTPANVKVTFGTGAFLLWNIGTRQPTTAPWLLTTIAYQMGKRATPRYAIEVNQTTMVYVFLSGIDGIFGRHHGLAATQSRPFHIL